MRVYRYEYVDTKMGPYSHNDFVSSVIASSHRDARHPTPKETLEDDMTNYGFWGKDWRSACVSRQLLGRWFYGFKAFLRSNGYRVVEYEVDEENVIGPDFTGQVVFFPDDY